MNIIRLTSPEHDWFFEQHRKDSVTQELFKVGDEVVACAGRGCGGVMLADSRAYQGRCNEPNCNSQETLTRLLPPTKSEIVYFKADRDIVWDNTPVKIRWLIKDADAFRTKLMIFRERGNNGRVSLHLWKDLPLESERELEVKEDMSLTLRAQLLYNSSIAERTIIVRVCNHAPVIRFWAESLILTESEPTTKLYWEVRYASKFGINNNLNIKETTGEIVVSPKKDTTYTLTATNISRKVANESITIKIDTAPIEIVAFQAVPSTILAGDEVILSWEVPLKQKMTLLPLRQEVTNSKYVAVKPTTSTSYTLQVDGHFSSACKEVEVRVYPNIELISFTTDNSAIGIGSSATLRWVVKHYDKITLVEGNNEIEVTHLTSYKITPTTTSNYHLVIESKGGIRTQKSKNVIVEVFYPVNIQSFQADRVRLVSSMPVVFTWRVQNATQVFITPINNQTKDVTQAPSIKDTPIKTTQYKLFAKNKLFDAEDIVLVQVMPLPSFNQDNPALAGAANFVLITNDTPIPLRFSSLESVYNNHTPTTYSKITQLFFDYTHLLSYFRDKKLLYYSSIKNTFVNLLAFIRSKFQN